MNVVLIRRGLVLAVLFLGILVSPVWAHDKKSHGGEVSIPLTAGGPFDLIDHLRMEYGETVAMAQHECPLLSM